MRIATAVIVALAAVVVPAADQGLEADLEEFLALFEGEFDNRRQVAAEITGGDGDTLPETDRHPWHHHTIRRVAAPTLGEHVFVGRINERGPDGPLVRARLYVIGLDRENEAIEQRFFAVEAAADPGVVVDLEAVDDTVTGSLRAYPEGCQVRWRRQGEGFTGEIAIGECRIVSPRSGRPLVIAARMGLDADGLLHLEEGFDENLVPLFSAPGGRPFELRRVAGR